MVRGEREVHPVSAFLEILGGTQRRDECFPEVPPVGEGQGKTRRYLSRSQVPQARAAAGLKGLHDSSRESACVAIGRVDQDVAKRREPRLAGEVREGGNRSRLTPSGRSRLTRVDAARSP